MKRSSKAGWRAAALHLVLCLFGFISSCQSHDTESTNSYEREFALHASEYRKAMAGNQATDWKEAFASREAKLLRNANVQFLSAELGRFDKPDHQEVAMSLLSRIEQPEKFVQLLNEKKVVAQSDEEVAKSALWYAKGTKTDAGVESLRATLLHDTREKVILAAITFGRDLDARAKGRLRSALVQRIRLFQKEPARRAIADAMMERGLKDNILESREVTIR